MSIEADAKLCVDVIDEADNDSETIKETRESFIEEFPMDIEMGVSNRAFNIVVSAEEER